MDKVAIDRKLKFIRDYAFARNAATGSEVDSNANVSTKNIATMSSELFKPEFIDLNRAIVKIYLERKYGKEMCDKFDHDLKQHLVYSHDETSLMPYCVAVSLYPFLLSGLKELGGTSDAPKHADSFVGGLTNLLFLIAGQFAGAVAVPETLPYLDHFLRVDYGEDYTAHLDEVVECFGNRKLTLRKKIENLFQQFAYCVNQPAAARGYQSPFTNIGYFDKGYFGSLFHDFIFPDGDEPSYESTKELQKMFMKWFNAERLQAELTFPVETANLLHDNKNFVDDEMADFVAEMWSEGHSFFLYTSSSADALSSCCFDKDQMVLARSTSRGKTKVWFTTFENLGKTSDGSDRTQFQIFHNGNWVSGRKIVLDNEKMFKVTTANNKEIIVSYNHLNPTIRGDVATENLTTDDYLMFNNRALEAVPEQDSHLTYEQGFVVGMFLGDGSFGSTMSLASGEEKIFDVNFSLNSSKYAECVEKINIANRQLGDDGVCSLSEIYNNVYPARISSETLVNFIIKWTNWERGTYSFNKELNMECMLQSSEFRKGILEGWYATDGGNPNRCYTTSKKLAECMEMLITSIGLNSAINISDRRGEETYIRGELTNHNYPLYCVRWYNPKTKRKMEGVYKIINNSMYFKIKSIEPVEYDDKIYCFEIDNEEEPYFTLPNGIITHNCRLKNAMEANEFSYTLGAGGVMTGSKKVITLNINRLVQNWYREGMTVTLSQYITEITSRVHKYLEAWNDWLHDLFEANLLTVYKAGFIDLDKQYLTVGFNGFLEGAEFLSTVDTKYNGIKSLPDNEQYKQYAKDILVTIKELNVKDRTEHLKFNTEMTPCENAGAKLYAWDKRDGYVVPKQRNLYNSYFYPTEDPSYDPLTKMKLQGEDFIGCLDGGSAYHMNLDTYMSKEQTRKMMDNAIATGCSYYTQNIPNTCCNSCGHIDKRFLKECPECGSINVDYMTRIIGYLKKVSNFGEARQIEAATRYYAKVDE